MSEELDENTVEKELELLIKERELIREKAFKAFNKVAHQMVERELQRNPPSLYEVGETILIRVAKTKKSIKGKKVSLKDTCEGVVLKADHEIHKYLYFFKYCSFLK